MAGFSAENRFDGALARLAAAQHAVFALDQLRALGLSASSIHKRAAANRLHRIHRGVHSLVPPPLLGRHGRWMAAGLACGPGAVLSHRLAAGLLGLRATSRTLIDVTVPDGEPAAIGVSTFTARPRSRPTTRRRPTTSRARPWPGPSSTWPA